ALPSSPLPWANSNTDISVFTVTGITTGTELPNYPTPTGPGTGTGTSTGTGTTPTRQDAPTSTGTGRATPPQPGDQTADTPHPPLQSSETDTDTLYDSSLYDTASTDTAPTTPGTTTPRTGTPLPLNLTEPKNPLLTGLDLDPKGTAPLPSSPLPWAPDSTSAFIVPEITPAHSTTAPPPAGQATPTNTAPTDTPRTHTTGSADTGERTGTTDRRPATNDALPASSETEDGNEPGDGSGTPAKEKDRSPLTTQTADSGPGSEENDTEARTRTREESAPERTDTTENGNDHDGTTGERTDRDGRDREEQSPPPSLSGYESWPAPDRNGTVYDLGYLLGANTLPTYTIVPEKFPAFVDERAADRRHGMDQSAKDDLHRQVREQINRNVHAFFGDEGRAFTATGGDGRTWRVDVSLRPTTGDFFLVPTTLDEASGGSTLKFVDVTGEPISQNSSGVHGGGASLGVALTVSPLYVDATPSGNSVGPRLRGRFSGGSRVRSSNQSVSNVNDMSSLYEIKGKPEVFVADLDMTVSIRPTGEGASIEGGNSTRPVTVKSENGLAMITPNTVTASTGPTSIRLRDPFTPAGDDDGRLAIDPRAGQGHVIRVGDIRGVGESSGTSLNTWVTDYLNRVDKPQRTRDRMRDTLPSFLDPRPERRAEIDRQVEREFSRSALRNRLPRMTGGPVPVSLTDVTGARRVMTMWSVPTDYTRRGHTVQPNYNTRVNVSAKSVETNLNKKNTVGFGVGGGMGLSVDFPGARAGRVDAPFIEYSGSVQGSERDATARAGSVNWMTLGPNDMSPYEVERNYYVQFDGDPNIYRFRGDTVELLSSNDSRVLNGEHPPPPPSQARGTETPETDRPSSADTGKGAAREDASAADTPTGGDGSSGTRPPARPPFDHLALDHPTHFAGAAPRAFTWPDGAQYRDGDGGKARTVYEALALNILNGLSEHRPGLVLPDLARGKDTYARRPGREEAGYFDRSPREHRPLRRNYDIARFNTLKILDTVSEAGLRGGLNDLARGGITVDLYEPAAVNPASLFRSDEKLIRPRFVTVRLTAGFDRLRYVRRIDGWLGGELRGTAGRSSGRGKQYGHSLALGGGMFVWESDNYDVGGLPDGGGYPAVSLSGGRARSEGQGQELSHWSENGVYFPDESDVWHSSTTFDARLYEYDDIGRPRGSDRPLRERGLPLLGAPFRSRLIVETPTEPASGPTGRSDPWNPRARDIQPLPHDQAERMIKGGTEPGADTVRRRRDFWKRRNRTEAPSPPTDATGEDTANTTRDGAQTGTPRHVRVTPREAVEEAGPSTTTPREDTPATAPDNTLTTPREDTKQTESAAPTSESNRAQRRAERMKKLSASVYGFETHFRTENDDRLTNILEQTYQALSRGYRERRLHDGLSRKMDHFLRRAQGNKELLPTAVSPQVLAAAKNGTRVRFETSGGFWSPHDVRATVATDVDITSVDTFTHSNAMVIWEDRTTLNLADGSVTSWPVNLNAVGLGWANHWNPQPGDGPDPNQPLTNNDGLKPIPFLGPGAGWSLFAKSWGHNESRSYSQQISFLPKVPLSYAFTASGTVRQALEFIKNWSIGPTFPGLPHFRGWQAHVSDLLSGLVHVRDAMHAGMVEDRVVDRDGTLVLEPQPEPRTPENVRVRPGFENSGKRTKPADPGVALQNLVDDLASEGWELTVGSRNSVLHALTSQLGQVPNSGIPVPVRVRAIDQSLAHMNSPATAPLALEATVRVRLDTSDTEVQYLGNTNEYREKHKWEVSSGRDVSRSPAGSAGTENLLLTPMPFHPGGDGPMSESPNDSRPYITGPAAYLSKGGSRTVARSESRSESQLVDLALDTPYVKVSQNSRLTLDLTFSTKQNLANRVLYEQPAATDRREFSGSGDAGRVETVYPTSYIELLGDRAGGSEGGDRPQPPATASTGTVRARADSAGGDGDRRTGDTEAPERPVNDVYASLNEMMRTWTRDNTPEGQAPERYPLVVPTAVENSGQRVRDTAHVVVARSLGWTPPPNAVADGRYTPEAIRSAREHTAHKLGLNTRYNAIDQSLNEIALKALYAQATHENTDLIRIGRTEWTFKALTDHSSARILDVAPSGRINDFHNEDESTSTSFGHTGTLSKTFDARPAGRSDQSPIYEDHTANIYGSASGTSTSVSAGGDNRGAHPADAPDFTRGRLGPMLLVELDAKWAIGATSQLRGSAFRRAAGYVKDGVRKALGRQPKPPARWQVGHTDTKVSGWITQGDAVRLGIIGQEHSDRLKPLTARLHLVQEEVSAAEMGYLEARRSLEPVAAAYVADPENPQARQEYERLEAVQDKRRIEFERVTDRWVTALNELREAAARPDDAKSKGEAPGRGTGTDAPAPVPTSTAGPADTSEGDTRGEQGTRGGSLAGRESGGGSFGRGRASGPVLETIDEAAEPDGTARTAARTDRGQENLADRFVSELNITLGQDSGGTDQGTGTPPADASDRIAETAREIADLRRRGGALASRIARLDIVVEPLRERAEATDAELMRLALEQSQLGDRLSQVEADLGQRQTESARTEREAAQAGTEADAAAERARNAAGAADEARYRHEALEAEAVAATERTARAAATAHDAQTRHDEAQARFQERRRQDAHDRRRLNDLVERLPELQSRANSAVREHEHARRAYETRWGEHPLESTPEALHAWDIAIGHLDDASHARQREAESAERSLAEARREADALTKALAERGRDEERARQDLQALWREAERTRGEAGRAEQAERAAREEAERAERALERARTRQEGTAERYAELAAAARDADARAEQARADLREVTDERHALDLRLGRLESRMGDLRTALREAQDRLGHLSDDRARFQEEYDGLKSRWRTLMSHQGRSESETDPEWFHLDGTDDAPIATPSGHNAVHIMRTDLPDTAEYANGASPDRNGHEPTVGQEALVWPLGETEDTPPAPNSEEPGPSPSWNLFDPKTTPPLPGLDPKHPDDGQDPLAFLKRSSKRPYDPNGLLDLPFPENPRP
ncbi:hypothetical protein ACFHWE_23195, partial [Nocardiopsis sp. LOL_012]